MIKDLRKKTDIELGELISSLKVQLLEYRFKMANGDLEGVHKISAIRKMIATAMTVLSERNVKIAFTTHTIQLIRFAQDGKQEIKAIQLESLAKEVKKNNANKQTNKSNSKKEVSKTNKQPQEAKPANKNIQQQSSNKQNSNNRQKTVAIRRTAKG